MLRTEYFLVPMRSFTIISGWYMGHHFDCSVKRDNAEFKALFLSPIDGENSSYHQFHRQMMWIRNNCPTLKGLSELPEPKPLPVCQPDPDLLETLYTMKLMLGGTIWDIENGMLK